MTIEYLAPGVFVEEVPFRAKTIEGVPTSTAPFTGVYIIESQLQPRPIDGIPPTTSEDVGRALHEWRRLVAALEAPDWTDRNAADVGVTLIQLFAHLTESLLDWRGARPAAAVPATARLATAALALVSGQGHACREDMVAIAVPGSRVGSGVVGGLGIEAGADGSLTIAPGTAVDGTGRDVHPTERDDDARSDTAVRRKRDP